MAPPDRRRLVDLDDYDSLGKLKAWLEPWFRDKRGGTGRIDSTENVGELFGVHSGNIVDDPAPDGYVLNADGARGSKWKENTIGAAFQSLVLAESTLFAYWPLTEASGNAIDLGPYGLDLTAGGTGLIYGVDGPFPPQTAVDFDNTSDFQGSLSAALSDTLVGGVQPFTFEAIVYLPGNVDLNDAIVLVNAAGVGDFGMYLSSNFGTNGVSAIRKAVNTATIGVAATFPDLPTTRWTHLAFTYDGSNMRLYVDGVLNQTKANTANLGTISSTSIWIGRIGTTAYTSIQVSNVVIYTSALPAATITSHAAVFARGGEGGTLNIDHGGLYGLSDDDHPQYLLKSVVTTAGDLLVATASAVIARLGLGSDDQVLVADSASSPKVKWQTRIKTLCKNGSTALTGAVTLSGGSNVTLTQSGQDITIAATVVGSGAVDSIAKSGSTPLTGAVTLSGGTGVALTQAANDISIATGIGSMALVYRYTVAGSDKASIDTGADTADAGSNDWTNGDLLEVLIVARTDDAGSAVTITVTLNNDGGAGNAHYDKQFLAGVATAASAGTSLAQDQWLSSIHGSGGTSGYPGVWRMSIPDYAGTTFNKVAEVNIAVPDGTAGNNVAALNVMGYRSTSAITRLKVAGVSTAKLKVGSQVLIYKRLAS